MSRKKQTTQRAMVSHIAYRFYGVPTEDDAILEAKTFGCCRFLWNRMLYDHNTLYQEIGKVPVNTPADYKDLDECKWLCEVDSLALANVQRNLETAFCRFFDGISRYPRFKSKKYCKRSYTTNAVYSRGSCNIKLDEEKGRLKLPKHKDWVQLNMHRSIRPGGTVKSVTVTSEPDGKTYYSILVEYPKKETSKKVPEKMIGLDMSLPDLYVDNHGDTPEFTKPYRHMEPVLVKEQKRLSRKKEGSKRYERQRVKVAKLHAKAKHQRRDFLHKLSSYLVKNYDLIGIEDLDISALKKALKFGKSVSDNGWGMFVQMLEYKSEREGKYLIKIDRWFPSSKTCCKCGHVHKELTLSDRTYICPTCGHVMGRDKQAAINILNEAVRIWKELSVA